MEAKERRTRIFINAPQFTGVRTTIDCGSRLNTKETIKGLKRQGREQIRKYARELVSGRITTDVFKLKAQNQLKSIILGACCLDTVSEDPEILTEATNRFNSHTTDRKLRDLDAITAAIQSGALSPESNSFNSRVGELVNF